jgi:hypothetical protein
MILTVWTELEDGKFKSLPAKVVSKSSDGVFTIQYLSSTSKRTVSGKRIYTYEDQTYEITSDSIIQQVESEVTLGFEEKSPGNFVKFDACDDDDQDEDEDYVPESSSEDESDDWSIDSKEDDDDEEEPLSDEE